LARARRASALLAEERSLARRDSELAEESSAIRGSLQAAELELAVARRLLEGLRVAVSENVQHLRDSLVEGEECPVCGSSHHPRGPGAASDLGGILLGHEREVERLDALREEARSRLVRSQSEADQIARDKIRLTMDRASIGELPADLAIRIAQEADAAERFGREEAESVDELARIESSLADWHRNAELDREVNALREEVRGLKNENFELKKKKEADQWVAKDDYKQLEGSLKRARWEADLFREKFPPSEWPQEIGGKKE